MATDDNRTIAIVGAGQAGLHTAQMLRRRGVDAHIVLVGEEDHLPYQRPPLSKAFLKGEVEAERLRFRPEAFYADKAIDTRLATTVTQIDRTSGALQCSGGRPLHYDRLVLATGSTPLRLPVPGADLTGVFTLRGLDDARAIRAALAEPVRVLVVGGGYIGLEAAASARKMGNEVTVVERLPRLLARVTTIPVSDYCLELHRGHGIDVRLDETVVALEGEDRVTGARLASGEIVAADVVLVGIGVRPNDGLASAAGVACDDGILVDDACRSSDPRIYAAGDCARRRLADGTTVRLESVHNALVQAEQAAADIAGDEPPRVDPPWFWSDQYDVKLQTVGLFNGHTDYVVRGDPREGKFAVLYYRGDDLIALDAVGDPRSFMAGKKILKDGLALPRDAAGDTTVSLKDLASGPQR